MSVEKHLHEIGDISRLPGILDEKAEKVHKHSIDEIEGLKGSLEGKAPKNHPHPEYAEKDHKHGEYAPTNHRHGEYAEKEHEHSGYAAKNHKHSEYASKDHTHPESKQKVSFFSGEHIDLTALELDIQHPIIATNTGENAIHVRDYFVSEGKVAFTGNNILIGAGKRIAVRAIRTKSETIVILDGILTD